MTATSEKFYNRFWFLYPVIDLFLKPQKEIFFHRINTLPHGRLLEVGVGNGSALKYYKTHDVTGIDTSRKMLDQAQKHRSDRVTLTHMNGEALQFPDGMFDYVILSHVIAVVDNPEKLLVEIHRVLKSGGKVLILNHFTPTNWLKYFDNALESAATFFHLKSVFHYEKLQALKKFRLLSVQRAGLFSYFKILIYEKT